MDRENRKEAIGQMHRENIISAAEELFMEKGFEKTTMDDISRKAQYSKRTVYIYFKSKDELYCSIVIKGFKLLITKIKDAFNSSNNFMEQYNNFFKAIVDVHDNTPEYFNAILVYNSREIHEDECLEIEKEVLSCMNDIYKLIEDFLHNAQDEGIVLSNIDLKKTVFLLWSGLLNYMVVADARVEYIESELHATKHELTNFGAILLLNAILDPGGE